MATTTPTLCLNCGNFPCTCGNQYHQLSGRDMLRLLTQLKRIAEDDFLWTVDIKVSTKAGEEPRVLSAVLADATNTGDTKYMFSYKEFKSMPATWYRFLNTERLANHHLEEMLPALVKIDVDHFEHPAGLAMLCIVRCFGHNAVCQIMTDYTNQLKSVLPDMCTIFNQVFNGHKFGDCISKSRTLWLQHANMVKQLTQTNQLSPVAGIEQLANTYYVIYQMLRAAKNDDPINFSYFLHAVEQSVFNYPGWFGTINPSNQTEWYYKGADIAIFEEHQRLLKAVDGFIMKSGLPSTVLIEEPL